MVSSFLKNMRVKGLLSSACLCLVILIGSTNSFAEPAALIEHSDDKQQIIVRYSEVFGSIAEADNSISVEVYGDGSVRVHYPLYMKKAGEYTMQLSVKDLDALLQLLAEKHIPEFDTDAVKALKLAGIEEEALIQSTLMSASSASTSVIEINLDRYLSANNNGIALRNIKQKIRWNGLRTDKNRFPNISLVQDLAAAHQEMLNLMSHPNLERVK